MKRLLLGLAGLSCLAQAPAAAQPEARFDWFDYRGDDGAPRPGPGQFANPILQGFYPDPSNTRVGRDFYLVTSTFAYFPGLPVFKSQDLVHWEQIGNAINRPGQLDFARLGLSRGVFAPSIDHHDGLFYITNTCVDCGGNFVITARDARGPWSDPAWLPDLEGGIDPALFFDEDGSAWILNNGPPPDRPQYDGHRAIWIQRFDPARLRTYGPRTLLVNGGVDISRQPIWIEGPHIVHRDGWYYLSAAEGGTAEGHSQVVLRSRTVTGPYEPFAGNPILTQRDLPANRSNRVTSAGHADLVELPDGSWWATFLAVRPYREDYYNTGRETFLLPVTWRGGWPRITAPGEAIPPVSRLPRPTPPRQLPPPTAGAFVSHENFDTGHLPLSWLMLRNPREHWFRFDQGALVLLARPVGLGDFGNPSFLARRQQHRTATATTSVRFQPVDDGDEAGLAAFQNDEYWYSIGIARRDGRAVVELKRRAGPRDAPEGAVIAAAPVAAGGPVQLRIEADGPVYRFAYAAAPQRWTPLGADQDGTILSTRTAGGFVGAVFGLYALALPARGELQR